jgi:hypothetical protein
MERKSNRHCHHSSHHQNNSCFHRLINLLSHLRSLRCQVKATDSSHRGSYLFTVAPIGDAFSEAPDQSKEVTFVELENGRYTVQPTDRIMFEDRSFTRHNWEWPTGFKRQTEIYSCE